jgi:hypothetical protein
MGLTSLVRRQMTVHVKVRRPVLDEGGGAAWPCWGNISANPDTYLGVFAQRGAKFYAGCERAAAPHLLPKHFFSRPVPPPPIPPRATFRLEKVPLPNDATLSRILRLLK